MLCPRSVFSKVDPSSQPRNEDSPPHHHPPSAVVLRVGVVVATAVKDASRFETSLTLSSCPPSIHTNVFRLTTHERPQSICTRITQRAHAGARRRGGIRKHGSACSRRVPEVQYPPVDDRTVHSVVRSKIFRFPREARPAVLPDRPQRLRGLPLEDRQR